MIGGLNFKKLKSKLILEFEKIGITTKTISFAKKIHFEFATLLPAFNFITQYREGNDKKRNGKNIFP